MSEKQEHSEKRFQEIKSDDTGYFNTEERNYQEFQQCNYLPSEEHFSEINILDECESLNSSSYTSYLNQPGLFPPNFAPFDSLVAVQRSKFDTSCVTFAHSLFASADLSPVEATQADITLSSETDLQLFKTLSAQNDNELPDLDSIYPELREIENFDPIFSDGNKHLHYDSLESTHDNARRLIYSMNASETINFPSASDYQQRYLDEEFRSSPAKDFQRHALTHSGQTPFECNLCHKRFKRKTELQAHAITHSVQRPFECNLCYKRFKRKGNLQSHAITHSGQKPFECNLCHKRFKRKQQLQTHALTHTGETPFQCNLCHKKFTRKKHLQAHALTHSGQTPFECNLCQKSFKRKAHLQRHNITHSGEKRFECDKCKIKFSRKYQLTNHIKIHTTGSNLREHKITHIEEKLVECDVCQKRFKAEDLQSHQITHTEDKPFKCDENKDLVQYHTPKDRFICIKCGVFFSAESGFLDHYKRTHIEEKSFLET